MSRAAAAGAVLAAPFVAAGRFFRAAVTYGASAGTHGISLVSGYLANTLWLLSTAFLELARKGYGRNEAVYACLRLLSQSVPEPPLLVYRQSDEAGGAGAHANRELLPAGHPFLALLAQPNELMTAFEFWELTTLQLGVIGRSCWWKERANDGTLRALWPLRPDRVGPIYSASNQIGLRVLWGWSYNIPGTGEYLRLPRADVLSFNFPDPAGESGGIVEGLGPLQVLVARVSADTLATTYEGALLANYAAPSVVLSTETEIRSVEEAQLIKTAFKREFSGTRLGEPMVVGGKTTVTQLGFTLRDLAFPELRDIAESRIAAAFGVPAILVGLKVGLTAGIRATIAQQKEHFTETTLESYWRRYEVQVTNDIAAEYGPGLVCEFDRTVVKALAGQREKAAQTIAEAYGNGAVSVDEYRTKVLGLEPIGPEKGGDVRYVPTTVQPAELSMAAPAPVPAAPGAAPELPPPPPAQRTIRRVERDELGRICAVIEEPAPVVGAVLNGGAPRTILAALPPLPVRVPVPVEASVR